MENEEWQKNSASEGGFSESNNSREGYRSYSRDNGYGNRPQYNRGDRPQRPRFNRQPYNGNSERGFRPSGFGGDVVEENNGRSYNNNRGYNDHGGRNSYGNRGGYQSNRGGYQSGRGGYGNNSQDNEYGQHRGSRGGYGEQQGGYRSGGNRGAGYGDRQGGYRGGRSNYGEQGGGRGGYQSGRGGYQANRGAGRNGAYAGGGRGGYDKRQRTPGYDPNAKYSHKKRIEYKEYLEDPDAPLRLNKFLANAGVCSRREADEFIQAGVVSVNGVTVTELGTKVQRTDQVHFHDQLISIEKKVYVLLNKPKDYVTTSDDPQQRKTVMDLVKNCCRERIYPVGRLDRNTTGVLLFTNDGDMASKLTHPKFLKKKIYHVHLDKNCTNADLRQIAEGVTLEDGLIRADEISYASETDKKQVGIEIHSGKNRIVRRIFESLGYKVLKLDRVMFAGLTKKGLKRGDWRFLTEQEVAMLHMGSFD